MASRARKRLVPKIFAVVIASLVGVEVSAAAEPVQFNRDIRPILSDKCFACHGPDKGQRQGELRLDLEADAKADRGGYHAIVAGKTAESMLIEKITASDADERMPPAEYGKTLTPREIALLTRWIQEGAKWEEHWSWTAPRRPEVPAEIAKQGPSAVIDYFIRRRLKREGIKPAEPADRRTLLRRLSFDLTGLPPTPEEVRAFENDKSADAYEKVVERLLASPHYGERMAIYWLDLVRYADTNGIHGDNHRDHALYRDYVIKAFNENKPFDEFTVEQLAGDLLENAELEDKIASGYNRLLMTTREGGAQAKEYRAKYAADRVRNVSTVWLGVTLACAECHDHKFDPLTMKDFYSLAAFFADVQETAVGAQKPVKLPSLHDAARIEQLDAQIAAARAELVGRAGKLSERRSAWEKQQLEKASSVATFGPWHVVGPFKAADLNAAHKSEFGPEKISRIDFKQAYGEGKLKWKAQPKWQDGQVIKLSGDNSATYAARTVTTKAPTSIELSLGSDDAIRVYLNGKLVLDKLVSRAVAPDQEELTLKLPAGESHLLLKISNGSGDYGFYFRAGESGLPRELAAALRTPHDQRSAGQKTVIGTHFAAAAAELKPLRDNLARLEQEKQQLMANSQPILITTAGKPRMTRILPRGNWLDDSGQIVEPDTPAALPPLGVNARRATRLDLAHWLVHEKNPAVARVFVNRVWKLLFGAGIVRSLDDFGSQGEWPSHPELIDWLALDFQKDWNVKRLVRNIVLTETYRQSSRATAELRSRDPYNRLLARQSRYRLAAEMIRDNALAVSGLLVRKIGGPSVKPYQPAGYWKHLNFPRRKWQAGKGEDLYRRGLYTYWCRTFLHPSLKAFDAPTREEACVERPHSNTPLAALALLNDPTYVEAARALAAKIVAAGDTAESRIQFAFQRVLCREPTSAEAKLVAEIVGKHQAQYAQDEAAAKALLSVGDRPMPTGGNLAELAAWTSAARVLLNLHETITRF